MKNKIWVAVVITMLSFSTTLAASNKGDVAVSTESVTIRKEVAPTNSLTSVEAKNAIFQGGRILVPVEELARYNLHPIHFDEKKKIYLVDIPNLRVGGDFVYGDPNGQYTSVTLPTELINTIPYVDITDMSSVVGFRYATTKDKQTGLITAVRLMPMQGPMEKPVKKELLEPLVWTFDPGAKKGDAYEYRLLQKGEHIISPSWMELSPKGILINPKMTQGYIKEYKEQHSRVWPLITNQFNPELTHQILSNEKNWNTYLQELTMYALVYGFDGYNFDFEDIKVEDKEKLTAFVSYLSKGLRDYGIYTSIDVTGYSDSLNWSKVYDRKELAKVVDYIVLMAYDETWASSKTAGPVASYPWVKSNVEQLMKEVQPNKIVLGVPFYMRQWTESMVNGKLVAKSKTLPMKDILKIKEQYANKVIWNDTLKLNYLEIPTAMSTGINSSNEQKKVQWVGGQKIWFEDEQSMQYKLQLINDNRLAGMAAWRKGFEDMDIWNTIDNQLVVPKRIGKHRN